MQPQVETRSVTARGAETVGAFGMKAENSAHIFNILRSTLYSNKVLAVLREYSANAWDEHRAAGIPDRPIKVVLPTALEPTLRVRDYGRGLSEQQVFEVYTQYGSSTKRGDDLTVGALGIGCLLEGQPIVTLGGMTPVERVKVGDLVLTHRGRYRRVYETMTRHHVGKACRIYLVQNKKPLVLTSEHPVLVSNHLGNVRWERPRDIVGGYRSQKKGVGSWNTYAVLPATLAEESGTLDVRAVLGPQYEWVDGVCTRTTKFYDHSMQKVRVCRYEVVAEQDRPEFLSSTYEDVRPEDDEDDEDDDEDDGDYDDEAGPYRDDLDDMTLADLRAYAKSIGVKRVNNILGGKAALILAIRGVSK